jgi:hypothetical protein
MLYVADQQLGINLKLDMAEGAVIAKMLSGYLSTSAASDSVNFDNLRFLSGTNVGR